MSNSMDSAARVMSGTHGEAWMDGEKCGETLGFQAKITKNKESVAMCGQIMVDKKVMSCEGTGSIRFHKVNSRMAVALSDSIQAGRDKRVKLISNLNDPDAYGSERIVVYDASFDDLTLADWEAGQKGQIECPFTFTKWDYLDTVSPK
ncbi:phage tail tube protein [Agathobaculum sp. NTUH-O15-33]|uniref:phage tail tube protein n=1 Tax=Agathobaculum sp. NTUH-O15-33 TaxID=3079302 RepID=UPI0029589596|nr:phage tail tube protein [Agathobaculum sp. NTUH-O15-33]WNX85788.1 phage tail tube protein [Agathobaculum sp. NTUH-O15-33]